MLLNPTPSSAPLYRNVTQQKNFMLSFSSYTSSQDLHLQLWQARDVASRDDFSGIDQEEGVLR